MQNKNIYDFIIKKSISALDELANLVYPDALYCIACGKIIDASRPYRLCNDCMEDIRWASEKTCLKCGKLLSDLNMFDICNDCRQKEHFYTRGFTCCEYDMLTKNIIFSLKYGENTSIARTIGEIMHDRLEFLRFCGDITPDGFNLIIPVPIHKKKLKQRGFNQAALICESLYLRERKTIDVEYAPDLLVRIKKTEAMKGLDADMRKENINGAFRVRDRSCIEGKSVLLVDDIYTTGATVDEAARILLENGALAVYVYTFASGADMIK